MCGYLLWWFFQYYTAHLIKNIYFYTWDRVSIHLAYYLYEVVGHLSIFRSNSSIFIDFGYDSYSMISLFRFLGKMIILKSDTVYLRTNEFTLFGCFFLISWN